MARGLALGIVAALLIAAGAALVAAEEEDPLAELARIESSLRSEAPEAGGTVRAKSDAAMKASASLKKASQYLIVAEVIENRKPKLGRFSALKVKVISPPSLGSFKGRVKKDQLLWVLPKFKAKDGALVLSDPLTEILTGIRFIKKGEVVVIRPVEIVDGFYLADYVEKR